MALTGPKAAPVPTTTHKAVAPLKTGALSAEEKSIVAVLETSSEPVYQGDLVQHLGWSKVKVTRVLDKLEAKGLVERKRRGMTNLVTLKTAQYGV